MDSVILVIIAREVPQYQILLMEQLEISVQQEVIVRLDLPHRSHVPLVHIIHQMVPNLKSNVFLVHPENTALEQLPLLQLGIAQLDTTAHLTQQSKLRTQPVKVTIHLLVPVLRFHVLRPSITLSQPRVLVSPVRRDSTAPIQLCLRISSLAPRVNTVQQAQNNLQSVLPVPSITWRIRKL